jgi:hypothetical protein
LVLIRVALLALVEKDTNPCARIDDAASANNPSPTKMVFIIKPIFD